jgi:hypothetical protein
MVNAEATAAPILLICFSLVVLTNGHIGEVYGLYDNVMAAGVYVEGNYAEILLFAKSRGGTCNVRTKLQM